MILTDYDRYTRELWASGKSPFEIVSEKTYCRPEYQALIAPFVKRTSCLQQLLNQYRGNCSENYDRLQATVVRTEYGKDGYYMPLGYYDPDLSEDWLIANNKRGRILKRITKTTKPDAEYGFDANGHLVTIYMHAYTGYDPEPDYKMFIIHRENSTAAIKFSARESERGLLELCLDEFQDGLLQRRIWGYGNALEKNKVLAEAKITEHTYSNGQLLETVKTTIHFANGKIRRFTSICRDAWQFVHDEHGKTCDFYAIWSSDRPTSKWEK